MAGGRSIDALARDGWNGQRQLFDYAGRLDNQPVYVGLAGQSQQTSEAVWLIRKYVYDATERVIDIQVIERVKWDDRASLGWV